MFRFSQQATFVSAGSPFSRQNQSGDIRQLSRIQSTEVSFSFPYSEQSYLVDESERLQVERPVVDISFEYLATAGCNERKLGFILDGINSFFSGLNDEKNYYILSNENPVDANYQNDSPKTVLGVSQVVLNGYSIAGAVGDILRVTVQGQGLNCCVYTGWSAQQVPTIYTDTAEQYTGLFTLPEPQTLVVTGDSNPGNEVIALGSKDLNIQFPTGSAFGAILSGDGCLLQDFSLNFSIDRMECKKLGHAYPSARRISLPIHVTLDATAILSRYQIEKLSSIHCDDHEVTVAVNHPCEEGIALSFNMRGLQLESQHFKNSLDNIQSVTFSWVGVIGNVFDLEDNVIAYGSCSEEAPIRVLETAFWYDDFEDYTPGYDSTYNKNRKTVITGLSGISGEMLDPGTGYYSGVTIGRVIGYSGYSYDEFELYSQGDILLLNSGIGVNIDGFRRGRFSSYDIYGTDMLENYPTGTISSLAGTWSGFDSFGTGRIVASPE